MTDRELDALVAEKVMGWMRVAPFCSLEVATGKITKHGMEWARPASDREGADYTVTSGVPCYSTSIEAAWEVVEKAFPKGWHVGKKADDTVGDHAWMVIQEEYHDFSIIANADTAPRAICIAALKAVGVEMPSSSR